MTSPISLKANEPDEPIDLEDWRKRIAMVCTGHGIKRDGWPAPLEQQIIINAWTEKFSKRMTYDELWRAFDMNLRGDLTEDIQHFQCFSYEFFCKVCNLYMRDRSINNIKNKGSQEKTTLAIPAPKEQDQTNSIMQNIIDDYMKFYRMEDTMDYLIGWPLHVKLNFAMLMFDVNINEAHTMSRAMAMVVSELKSRIAGAKGQNRIGLEVECSNQIERIEARKLTDKDIRVIRGVYDRLVYEQIFIQFPDEQVFIDHVKSNMEP